MKSRTQQNKMLKIINQLDFLDIFADKFVSISKI